MNGLSDQFINDTFSKYMNQDYISRVFMFKDYIKDCSKENHRFEKQDKQQIESKKSFEYIDKNYIEK